MSGRDQLVAAARTAMEHAYAPYSKFRVGAALRLAEGTIVTGANVENASYGLSLCAETVAAAKALADGCRAGLLELAVVSSGTEVVTPCGRCRQVLHELAALGGTDPWVHCCGSAEVRSVRLSELLPAAFGPGQLD